MTAVEPIVLASASPRRRQLLRILGLAHEVIPADIEEVPHDGETAEGFALRAAAEKARRVAATHQGRLVLGADTVVEVEGTILGKPASDRAAEAMLQRLSGATHRVHTAMALARGADMEALVDTAAVRIRTLSSMLIRWYVATGEPRDKAGGYAVQGAGGVLVEAIEGSPHTVVGLPIHRLAELFDGLGLDLWSLLRPRGR